MVILRMMMIVAALVGSLAVGVRPATGQPVSYKLTATEGALLDNRELAGLALRALAAGDLGQRLLPADRAALLLAARDDAAAISAYRTLGCHPAADPASRRICFLGAWAQSRSPATALHDRLAEALAKADAVASERLFAWLRGRERADRTALDRLLTRHAGAAEIDIAEALRIVRIALVVQAYRATGPAIEAFVAEQRERLYRIDRNIMIRTGEGALLSATLIRPRAAAGALPTALFFTIYSDPERNLEIAAEAAAHGYAGLVVNARGKLDSSDAIRPYETEVEDSVAAINWASRQGWSDGRVGMYGGSYSGFAAWAATKRLPKALKTIVPYVAALPGQGLPMENNVFINANYGWPFYVTNNRTLDQATYDDPARWSSLNEKWYQSGRPYRDIDLIDGTPNPWLQRWLDHPSYDAYWQAMVPYRDEFARIDIPVLTITGYYDDGQISAVHYWKEHVRYRPEADHALVIGPYDHFGAQQSFKPEELRGYRIDPVAQFDTAALTFAWFDHIFHGAPRPSILADRINFQVMGANVWRHAASIDAMAEHSPRLFLTDSIAEGRYRLSTERPGTARAISQKVDFADRTTSGAGYYPFPILDSQADFSRGLVFATDPLPHAMEVSGGFSGELHVRTNKRDFDFMAALYEVRADGSSFALSYYLGRASYARDISVRQLLDPHGVNMIPFDRTRLTSRRVAAGSRLLLVVDVVKNSFHQINYGTGGTVAAESIDDAEHPLTIDWLTDSFVRIPMSKVP